MMVGCFCVDGEASVGVKLRIPSDRKATFQPKTLSFWNDFPRKKDGPSAQCCLQFYHGLKTCNDSAS